MQRQRFFKLLFFEAIIVTLVGAYFFIDSHDIYRWWVGSTSFVQADTNCDLHVKSCQVHLKDNTVLDFSIEPKEIPLMKPLRFSVTLEGTSLPFIELTLFATNMNMGLHTFKLFHKANGLYEGEGMLPTCIVGNMIWQANIIIDKPLQSLGATFYFQTH